MIHTDSKWNKIFKVGQIVRVIDRDFTGYTRNMFLAQIILVGSGSAYKIKYLNTTSSRFAWQMSAVSDEEAMLYILEN